MLNLTSKLRSSEQNYMVPFFFTNHISKALKRKKRYNLVLSWVEGKRFFLQWLMGAFFVTISLESGWQYDSSPGCILSILAVKETIQPRGKKFRQWVIILTALGYCIKCSLKGKVTNIMVVIQECFMQLLTMHVCKKTNKSRKKVTI